MDHSAAARKAWVTRKANQGSAKIKGVSAVSGRKTGRSKVMVKQNVYGNWHGYKSGRKVKMFFGSTTEQEIQARQWHAKHQ